MKKIIVSSIVSLMLCGAIFSMGQVANARYFEDSCTTTLKSGNNVGASVECFSHITHDGTGIRGFVRCYMEANVGEWCSDKTIRISQNRQKVEFRGTLQRVSNKDYVVEDHRY